MATVIDVGCDKQLFIDHRFIAECRDVELRVNPPVKKPGAIMESDRPGDAFNLIYFGIAEDEPSRDSASTTATGCCSTTWPGPSPGGAAATCPP